MHDDDEKQDTDTGLDEAVPTPADLAAAMPRARPAAIRNPSGQGRAAGSHSQRGSHPTSPPAAWLH